MIGESARGRETVAKMTPDETTATAIFTKKKKKKRYKRRGGRDNH